MSNNLEGCPLHKGVEDWLRDEQGMRRKEYDALLKKIDQIIQCQSSHYGEVKELKGIVTNGLRTTTEKTAETVDQMCAQLNEMQTRYNKKIDELEEFKWFRDWVNDARNHIFKYLIIWGLIGGGIVFFINYGKDLLMEFLKK